MNKFAKIALGAAMVAGAATLAAEPASAHVSVGIGFGVGYPGYYPGYFYGPRPYYRYCDPYSPYYDPYYCGDPYYDGYGYGPTFGDVVFFDGGWWRGPFRHRYYHGHDWYWVNNGWHRNEWHGRVPGSITFRNGGSFNHGRYNGFNGAEHFGRSPGDFRTHIRGGGDGGDRRFNGGSFNGRTNFDSRSNSGTSFHGNGSWRAGHSGGDHGDHGGHHGH